MYIKKFDSFNEGLLKDFSSKLKNKYTDIKYAVFGSESNSKLKKWRISSKKVDDKYSKFLHNDKIVAELRVDGTEHNKAVFRLTVYYYESEIKNTDGLSLKKQFDDQEEQPYAKGSKKFFNTEAAIDFLVAWWSKYTNSGTSKNSDYKIKL